MMYRVLINRTNIRYSYFFDNVFPASKCLVFDSCICKISVAMFRHEFLTNLWVMDWLKHNLNIGKMQT